MAAPGKPSLAQYFTPPAVVAFVLDALDAVGMDTPPARIIDPACGDGAFLREARRRFPRARLWGCDVDGALAERWHAAGLRPPAARLLVHDGLEDAPAHGLRSGRFDLVIGNPPYGRGVPRPAGRERIEALFLDRFVALARPGGWIALILPEGLLANARSQRQRDAVGRRAAPRAVVALPEATFAPCGTRARTALLLARKGEPGAGRAALIAPDPRAPGGRRALGPYLRDALRLLSKDRH